MLSQLILPVLLLITADAGFLLVLGYEDVKNYSFPVWVIPAYLVLPSILYYVLEELRGLLIILGTVITIAILVMVAMNMLGWGDIVLGVRVPLLIPLMLYSKYPYLPITGFVTGVILAWYLYHVKNISPHLCRKSLFVTRAKVRRESLMEKHIIPVNIPIEASDEVIEKAKKKLLSSKTECIDAYILLPFVYIFSIGYALAVILTLT